MFIPEISITRIVAQNAINILKLLDSDKISSIEAETLAGDNAKDPEKVRDIIAKNI